MASPTSSPTSPAATAASTRCSAGSTPTRSRSAPGAFTASTQDAAGAATAQHQRRRRPGQGRLQLQLRRLPVLCQRYEPRLQRQPDHLERGRRRLRQLRIRVGLQPDPGADARPGRVDAGVGDPGHLRLHRGRPQQVDRAVQRVRARRGRRTSTSSSSRTRRSSAFFERLAADGINKSNTLFVFTADEGDHFAGTTPTNTGCDGVNTACTYPANGVGEQTALINDALAKEFGDTRSFAIHFDDAPNFYVGGPTGSTAPPGPYDPAVRQLEQDLGNADAHQPGKRRHRAGDVAHRGRRRPEDPAHDDDRSAADAVVHRLRGPDVLLPDGYLPGEQRDAGCPR